MELSRTECRTRNYVITTQRMVQEESEFRLVSVRLVMNEGHANAAFIQKSYLVVVAQVGLPVVPEHVDDCLPEYADVVR